MRGVIRDDEGLSNGFVGTRQNYYPPPWNQSCGNDGHYSNASSVLSFDGDKVISKGIVFDFLGGKVFVIVVVKVIIKLLTLLLTFNVLPEDQ
jgi:hypothetical protein